MHHTITIGRWRIEFFTVDLMLNQFVRSKVFITLLLSFASVVCNNFQLVVTRFDKGDEFIWSGIVQAGECGKFSGNSAYSEAQKCHCDYGQTFSTEMMFSPKKCQSYRNRGKLINEC